MRIILTLLILFLPVAVCANNSAYSTQPYTLKAEDKATLARVENYLSSVHTISAQFTQAAPNGDISNGTFYLQRPGKLRMEYQPPTPVLMVSDGNNITYYDKELDQVSHISLESTLVGFLARDEVKFDNTVIITGIEEMANSLRINLIQTKRPKDGMLTLEFADKPLALRNMIVTDGSGQTTTVSLNDARFNAQLDKALFVFKDPHIGKKSGIRQ